MKKRNGLLELVVAAVLVLLLVSGLAMAGCAQPSPAPAPTPAPTPAPAPAPTPTPTPSPAPTPSGELLDTFVFTASTGGVAYSLGSVHSEILNKYSPEMKSAIEVVATGAERLQLMREGEVHCQYWSPSTPLQAYRGEAGYEQTRLRNLFSGGFPAATCLGWMVRADSPIETVNDLKGKTVYGNYGRVSYFGEVAEVLLKFNGMSTDDMEWLTYGAIPDAFRDIKEKRADAIFSMLGTASLDLAESVGMRMLPLSTAEQDAVNKAYPAIQGFTLPKGNQGLPEDTPGLASFTGPWVMADLSDVSAYTAVKILFEHLDEFYAAYPTAEGYTVDNVLNVWVIPYHPGSIAYFKEIGIWGPEEEQKQQALLEAEKQIFKD